MPELFEQVLKYAYYQDCDMMKEGALPFKIHRKTRENTGETCDVFSSKEMHESAHQVYSKNSKKNSKNASSFNENSSSNNNILIQLQDLARRLGFHDMVKNLDHFTYNANTNR